MPGVLLIECMAQTTGWLVSALGGFTAMPVLAGVKEAKFRTAVFPGDELEFEGKVRARGLGLRHRRSARAGARARPSASARLDLSHDALSEPGIPPALLEWAERIDVAGSRSSRSDGTPRGVDHRRRSAHLPGRGARGGLAASRARRSAALRRQELCALHRASARRRSSFDKQIPKKSDQRQMEPWQRIGVYAAGLALADAGIAGKPELLDRDRHDRRRRRRRARHRRRYRDP